MISLTIDGDLACPTCNEGYLHQIRVDTFFRDSEDSERGMHVNADRHSMLGDQSMVGNPSSRRDGVKIYFTCEFCHTTEDDDDDVVEVNVESYMPPHVLCIVQHKGFTHIYWEGYQ